MWKKIEVLRWVERMVGVGWGWWTPLAKKTMKGAGAGAGAGAGGAGICTVIGNGCAVILVFGGRHNEEFILCHVTVNCVLIRLDI